MTEYRWKIKYPDGRKSQAGPWFITKKKALKNFFQSVCADPELASTMTMDLKETVYLDKRILQDGRAFADCCMGSDNPFQYQKYSLFSWKVKCFGGDSYKKKS